MKIYLDEPIAASAIAMLDGIAEVTNDFDHLENVDAMIIRRHKITREDLLRAPKLRVISRHGIGCDMLDLDACRELGIPVETLPGANAQAVAELAVAFIMALSRNLAYGDRGVRDGSFSGFAPKELYGFEIFGKTLGLIGVGNIGSKVGTMLKNGFGMRVLAYSPSLTPEKAAAMGFEAADVETILRNADYVNISVPLTASTRNLIDEDALAMMKSTAILVNTARGGIVDEAALYEALAQKRIFAAACDVFEEGEPPRQDHPLLTLDNFMAMPHCGPATYENGERSGRLCVENVLKYFQ